MGNLTRRLFGWLVPERDLTVDPRLHPYYPGELPSDVIRDLWDGKPLEIRSEPDPDR